MIVADPLMTARQGARAGPVPLPRARRRLRHHAEPPPRGGQPVRVHRPPDPVDASATEVVEEAEEAELRGARHPARPAARLPGRRRRGQPDRVPRHRRAARRPRAHLRRPALRHRRLGPLRGRRRQPDPARREHRDQAGRRPGPADHHRPRPAVVHPAGAAADRRGLRRRVRLRGRDGPADRRAAGGGRPPDVRRELPDRVAQGGPRLPRHAGRLRAGLGREGAHRSAR